jgi:putative toxin-antitoxin system antitoxin component (TIGR02293 family)
VGPKKAVPATPRRLTARVNVRIRLNPSGLPAARCHRIESNLRTDWRPSAKAAVLDTPISQAGLFKRVQEILGVHRLRSDHDLLRLVEGRLPTRAIEGLRRSGLTDAEIYSLVVPRRTLTHRRARREALSQEESDRAVRLARIAALAEQVFGDGERSWRWLRASKRQFHSRSPLQLVATEAGARLVEELLYEIAEGMAA